MEPTSDVKNLSISSAQIVAPDVGNIYMRAFREPPYSEGFDLNTAMRNLQSLIEQGGDVLVASVDGEPVALAGGYVNEASYWIEELAVDPDRQGEGIGRQVLKALLMVAVGKEVRKVGLRTNVDNYKAIGLYESVGFKAEGPTIVVPSTKNTRRIELDERVYLTTNLSEEPMEELEKLRRMAVLYPSGNTTAVVFDQVLGSDRKTLNDKIMGAWKTSQPELPEIEQCCFVTRPTSSDAIGRVEMFGGEFCGNATRSVVWMLTGGIDYEGIIEVSGVDKPLEFRIQSGVVELEMPLPKDKSVITVPEGKLVQLDGIAQLVVTNANPLLPSELLSRLKEENKYGLARQPAVGVSYYDSETNQAEFNVWVNSIDTVFDETACGSGTCAIGVALATERKESLIIDVVQPSGETIGIKATWDNETQRVVRADIVGGVDILYDDAFSLV